MGCCCCSKMHNACNKFKKKCLKVDGERPCSSFYKSNIPAFFKIMIGDFVEALVIPPKFARTLQGMVDKNIYLEDSNSNCWMVKLSTTDGSLAFTEGWQDFVLDHSVSLGEIVIFKHISFFLFSVQFFGTSGSERLQFQGKENSNDRKRKQRKNENLPDILRLIKAQKSYADSEKFDSQEKVKSNIRKGKRKKDENSCEILCLSKAQKRYEAKGKHCNYEKDLSKKCKVEKSSPCDLDSNEMAAWDCPIVLSDDDDEDAHMMILSKQCKKIHKKKPEKKHVKNGEGTQAADNRSSDNCLRTTERKSSMAYKHAVQKDEEVVKIIPTNSVNHETFQNIKNPEDTNISMANERNIAQYEKAMAVDHVENKEGDAEECNIVHATEKEKEVTQITPANLPQPETFQSKRSIINDTKGLDVNEELFHDRNSLEILKPTSAADCAKREIKIHNEAPQVQNATMKDRMENGKISSDSRSEPEKFLNKLDDLEIVGHNYDRPECATPNYIEDGDQDLTISKGFARKSLSYAADEDSKKKLEVSRDTLISVIKGVCKVLYVDAVGVAYASISAIKGDCNVLYVDAVGVARKSFFPFETSPVLYVDAVGVARKSFFPSETSPEVPSDTPILNCNRSDQQNPQPNPSKENLEDYGEPSEAKPKPVESNPAVMEVQPFQYGTVSNEFPEVNAKNISPCSKEVLIAVKTEILDSAPTIAPNDAEFSTTVTLNSQSWLLLPVKLPACLFRRKYLKNVVLLQDPSMKLWPVLYHNGLKFIGFVDGWEDFTIANNLHQGDTCLIESIDAFEPTLKVQLSKVKNLGSLA